jgi:hypothetical protein
MPFNFDPFIADYIAKLLHVPPEIVAEWWLFKRLDLTLTAGTSVGLIILRSTWRGARRLVGRWRRPPTTTSTTTKCDRPTRRNPPTDHPRLPL